MLVVRRLSCTQVAGIMTAMHIMFDNEAIERLRQIVADAYGESVTTEEARTIANDLLAFYNVLARIVDQMPEERRAELGLSAQSAQ